MSHTSIEVAPGPSVRTAHAPPSPSGSPEPQNFSSRNPSATRSRHPSLSAHRSRHISPNDARFKAPSTDALNDLLASIPDITFPDPLQPTPTVRSPGQLTPARRSRLPSISPSPRLSTSPNRGLPNPTHDFYEYSHPIQDSTELPPEEDAAEPPVVRTSRPPSTFSKPSKSNIQAKVKPKRGIGSPQVLLSPPPEPEVAPAPKPLYDGNNVPTGYMSPGIKRAARRDSLDSTRTRQSFQTRVLNFASRNRQTGLYSPSRVSLRSEANDAQRAGKIMSGPQTPMYRSIPASARISEDQGERPNNVMPTHSPSPLNRSTPMSPLQNESEHPNTLPTKTFESSNGVPVGPQSSPPHVSEPVPLAPVARGNPDNTTLNRKNMNQPDMPYPQTNDDQRQTDVMRRIKELKAAKEERRKSVEQATYIPSDLPHNSPRLPNGAVSPVQGSQPDTAVASKQLAEAAKLQEHEILVDTDPRRDSYSLDYPPLPDSENTLQTPTAPIISTRSPELASGDNLDISNSNARRKRWSPLAVPSTVPSSPKPEHRRNRNSFSRQPTVAEDRRPSMDVVHASVRDFLASPRFSQKILFPPDGRNIAFSEVGDPNGAVVFCCVGMGLTRYITAYYDELATSLKLRLITPDRPGKGDSDPYINSTISPFDWPDDIKAICSKLGVSKFSILAHSAGTIYALATALRMPGLVRGKIHLLAPWIPQSQFESQKKVDTSEAPFNATLTKSQRFLRILPTSLLKLSNSSLTGINRTNSPKASQGKGRKSQDGGLRQLPNGTPAFSVPVSRMNTRPASPHLEDLVEIPKLPAQDMTAAVLSAGNQTQGGEKEAQRLYDEALTPAIWELATRNGNPAVDLIVCLERNAPVGFRYTDVGSKPIGLRLNSKPDSIGHQWPGHGVVIHHGSKDTRVPIENVKWLGRNMTNAEVRILEGQGHGLMSTAGVMGSVLTEIGKDWDTNGW